MKKKSITIQLNEGPDARPIAVLVQVASQYESTVHIHMADKHVNAKSIMGMMTLVLSSGEEVVVIADGSDEDAAIESISKYLCGQA